jgi:hypothetical protein
MRGSSDNRPIILELSRAKGTLMLAVLRIAFALGLMFCVDVVAVPDISFADADTGLLGTTWATVQKNEFFDFFHLAEVARRSDQGYTIVDYRPAGGRFWRPGSGGSKMGLQRHPRSLDACNSTQFY